MENKSLGINSICAHVGTVRDTQFNGAISPIYMATSYAFDNQETLRYPRYQNTPNQEALVKKIAALEQTEDALIFGSGMAAISTTIFAFLKKGDHIVLQQSLYGGTYNFVLEELDKFGIEYSFTKDVSIHAFKEVLQTNTKIIYIESPSNPLLTITDMKAVSELAKNHEIITVIDNTFASPINQRPKEFGIDIIIHSATKYMGGHSDILAGAVAASTLHIETIWKTAINFGGSLSDFTVWMLERSLKTLNLRVKCQSENAQVMARYLVNNPRISKVFYPGLKSHPNHQLAKEQMFGFGAMIAFELNEEHDAVEFQRNLELIKPSMSLAGVESTMLNPAVASHALLGAEERAKQGITDGLIRFSVGIEETDDLIADIEQALDKSN